MKKYIELEANAAATHLKIEVYYHLGGYNCFTAKSENRGYYLSVSPVSRSDRYGVITESYTAFSGIKQCVKTVTRKSAKAEQEAIQAAARIENTLVEWVCNKNGLPLPVEVTA